MGFPVGTIDKLLSKGVRGRWPIQKRNWGREVDSVTYCFLKSYLPQTQEFPEWGFSIDTWGVKLIALSLGVSQKSKRCEWRQGL